MQKQLLGPLPSPKPPLQARHRPRNIGPHARRPANKNTSPPPKLPTQLLEHVRNIRPPVLGAPAILLLRAAAHARQKGEAHEVFLEHGGGGGEAEIEGPPTTIVVAVVVVVVKKPRIVRRGDVEFETRFVVVVVVARVRFGRGRDIRDGQVGDGVFVLAPEFAFFFHVPARFVADEGAGPLAGDALERVVDFRVQQIADGAGRRVGLREGTRAVGAAAGGLAFRGRDEEAALYRVRRCVIAADFQFLFEPLEGLRPFEGPNDVHGFRHGLAVAHFFDQVEELADDCGDSAAAGEKDDGVEGGEVALHAAVGAVDEGAVGLVGALFRGGVEDFTSEAAEGAEDEGHVAVLVAVGGGEVGAAKGGDSEGVVFEDGYSGHSEVDVLAWTPLYLRRDRYFDGVFGKYCDCCFLPY